LARAFLDTRAISLKKNIAFFIFEFPLSRKRPKTQLKKSRARARDGGGGGAGDLGARPRKKIVTAFLSSPFTEKREEKKKKSTRKKYFPMDFLETPSVVSFCSRVFELPLPTCRFCRETPKFQMRNAHLYQKSAVFGELAQMADVRCTSVCRYICVFSAALRPPRGQLHNKL
jgi:hypothetical protein